MKIRGLTQEQIEACARAAGHFKLDNVRREGNYVLFVLRMASGVPSKRQRRWLERRGDPSLMTVDSQDIEQIAERMKYRKRLFNRMVCGRGPEYGAAVCFHGFREFMRECFKVNPQATIRTCRAAYLGSEDFEKKWSAVGGQLAGSKIHPVSYDGMCDCYGY